MKSPAEERSTLDESTVNQIVYCYQETLRFVW